MLDVKSGCYEPFLQLYVHSKVAIPSKLITIQEVMVEAKFLDLKVVRFDDNYQFQNIFSTQVINSLSNLLQTQ